MVDITETVLHTRKLRLRKIKFLTQMSGKRPGHQKCLTGFLMAKRSRAGFPDRNKPDCVGGGFYTFLARDGQVRWMEVRIGRQAETSLADGSFYVAGVGRL